MPDDQESVARRMLNHMGDKCNDSPREVLGQRKNYPITLPQAHVLKQFLEQGGKIQQFNQFFGNKRYLTLIMLREVTIEVATTVPFPISIDVNNGEKQLSAYLRGYLAIKQ